jgi:hypothetical protein
MTELVFLALMNRLTNWGLTPLIATRTVAADADAVHRFLGDADNQLRLLRKAPRDIDVRVEPRAEGRMVAVEILRGRRPALWATWILSAGRGTTEVDLVVQFESRGLATRLTLMLGGRRRLARRVDDALARLGQACTRTAEDIAPAPGPGSVPAADCSRRARATRSIVDTKREMAVHRATGSA